MNTRSNVLWVQKDNDTAQNRIYSASPVEYTCLLLAIRVAPASKASSSKTELRSSFPHYCTVIPPPTPHLHRSSTCSSEHFIRVFKANPQQAWKQHTQMQTNKPRWANISVPVGSQRVLNKFPEKRFKVMAPLVARKWVMFVNSFWLFTVPFKECCVTYVMRELPQRSLKCGHLPDGAYSRGQILSPGSCSFTLGGKCKGDGATHIQLVINWGVFMWDNAGINEFTPSAFPSDTGVWECSR